MTWQAQPKGICSWDFQIRGTDGFVGKTSFGSFGESGEARAGELRFLVEKEGFFSPEWLLVAGRKIVAEATKESAFRRTFQLRFHDGLTVKLRAQGAFGRKMMASGDGLRLLISPRHPFTRRAVISGHCHRPEALVFCFWLTALVWRRAASRAASQS